jgi:AraC-like DNA-binding protein
MFETLFGGVAAGDRRPWPTANEVSQFLVRCGLGSHAELRGNGGVMLSAESADFFVTLRDGVCASAAVVMIKHDANVVNTFFDRLGVEHGESLFDFLPDVQFFIKNREGLYMWANRGLLDNYLLRDKSEIIGKSDYDLAPPFLADQWVKDDQEVLLGKEIRNRMELVGRYDMTVAWYVTNKIPLRSRSGEILGLAGITRKFADADDTSLPFHELNEVLDHIRRNFWRSIKLQELADISNLSIRALERKFQKYFQISPNQYIRRLRVSMACQALINTDDSISSIAHKTGFCDHSYLSKEFLKATGKTPKEFRDAHQGRLQMTPP